MKEAAFFIRNHGLTGLALIAGVMSLSGCVHRQYGPSDGQVIASVQARIATVPGLSANDVQVSCANGVVVLSGIAPNGVARALATKESSSVEGVHSVINNLMVEPSSDDFGSPPESLPENAAPVSSTPGHSRPNGHTPQVKAPDKKVHDLHRHLVPAE